MYLAGIHLSDNILSRITNYASDPQTPDFTLSGHAHIYSHIYILNEWGRFVPNLIHRLAVVYEGLMSLPREAGLYIPPDGRTMN